MNLTAGQDSLNKQVPKNLIFNFAYFGLNIIIGLLLVPYFIDTLGVAGYALIPLATSMTNYVNLVIQALNSSVSRYLTIDLQKEDYNKANITFNTALFGTLGLVLLLLPIVALISYFAPEFFSIQSEQKTEVVLLFAGVICAFLIRAWSSNFGVSLFAYNRLDLQNIISTINLLSQVLLIIILFTLFSPRLSYIGLSYLIAAIIASIVTFYLSRKINPHLKIRTKDIRVERLKSIMGTGGWMTINLVGSLLYLQIDLILVNKIFGTVAGGEYSTVLMWSILIRSVAGLLAGLLTPIILAQYAKDMFEEIIIISKTSVKFLGLAMALPIGIICGFSSLILSLWIGTEFTKLWPLMIILLIHLVINLAVFPLFSINIAYNKVRTPGLVTFFMGIGNLLLALVLSYYTNLGYYAVAIAGAIMLTAKNSLFTPLYAAKIMGIKNSTFIGSLIPGIIAAIITALISVFSQHYLMVSDIFSLILVCGVIAVLYVWASWTFCITKYEKRKIQSLIPPRIWRKLNVQCN